ncbi:MULTISPECIES: hypothetical protein [unclassified Massilia]|uniref:hypothetical protein n=1 Tax=unclassified Massilia TaxID=2609279 RepID=UPI001B8251CC|nr:MULTISPECIES: hypothetical protein [unclassified Massilia]MBQ5939229.1 hypothetical protein [Massilia sp. AB1]MBQ5965592.1 hypothetical protein [Massilia sp. ZL223]
MSTQLSKLLAAGAFAFAAAGVCAPATAAPADKHPKAEAVLKAQAKKSKSKAKKAKAGAAGAAAAAAASAEPTVDPSNPEQAEPDITDTIVTEYACELNNKVTIYTNEKDDAHIALRWKKRLHRLARVGTTTGAQRFENPFWGLIWIGIPAKGILLDSRLNRQLANECKTPQQAAPIVASSPEEKKS